MEVINRDSTFIAVDPGTRFTSVSVWKDRKLTRVLAFRSEHETLAGRIDEMANEAVMTIVEEPAYSVVEVPRVYPDDKRGGEKKKNVDPEDLISLTLVAGGFLLLGRPIIVRPQEWKGNLPKDVCKRRIEKILKPEELLTAKIVYSYPGTLQHNLWDAIGIGLFACGRFRE